MVVSLIETILHIIPRCWLIDQKRHPKFKQFVLGQHSIISRIKLEMEADSNSRPVVWIHAASLGEFGVMRPVIAEIKKKLDYQIILTFFSPTGYEALKKKHPDIDHVFYLPLDSRTNARQFIEAIHPQLVLFAISEYWINYLQELRAKSIPVYLVSALITNHAPFFKWYGELYKKSLDAYSQILVLDEQSQKKLASIGYHRATVIGDPLFDNVLKLAHTPWKNEIIERFSQQGDIFIAGSISDKKDLALVCHLANNHKDVRFIFVPHEICEENLNEIKYNLCGKTLLYSECTSDTDFSDTQVLVIDFLGALAYLYRYGKWAYVGGGFTPYLHSIIEATVYGLPTAFGPCIYRKTTPQQMVELGIGQVVRTKKEIGLWFETYKTNPLALAHVKELAKTYIEQNKGASSKIIETIFGHDA